jgi:SAM-dependent methyltransferase
VPRFVPSESYTASFGFQWNQFPTLQIDKVMNNNLSRDRFYATTGWSPHLEGQRILEAGCGAGRFTQLALETGAEVFSFDLSRAVEAAWKNNEGAPNLHLFQASIYQIPLRQGVFDKIFCMGVLQHCPDVKGAFMGLIPYLRDGGEVVIDVYRRWDWVPPLKYWARPLVRWMTSEDLFGLLRVAIPVLFDVKKTVNRVPGVGRRLAALVPIGPLSHAPRLNYTEEELKQVKVLSAFDMLSPTFDQPQRMEDVRAWLDEAGLANVEVGPGYNGITAKGTRSNRVQPSFKAGLRE